MLAPSATTLVPFSTNILADSASISPCVAQGNATSHFIVQIFLHPSKYFAVGTYSKYSFILPLLTSFISLTTSTLIPFSS